MTEAGSSRSGTGQRTVAIVPHTHWDREWYSGFQTFRLRLVDLLDEFLPRLEADPAYARFLLDGQMAVVDDYLEVRPEGEAPLRRLAGAGRLSVGPWYTLPDEFCVSGETLVRDLQLGLDRATSFGGAMEIGYLPDMFGHVAQMPQLLRQFGFEHAVVWRGVPRAIDRTAFWWQAPDGSTVRAEYLPEGYGNGAAIPEDAKALLRRIEGHAAELGDTLLDGLLFMNGTDHQVPQPWLGRVVAEVNDLQDDWHLEVTSLAEYLALAPTTQRDGSDLPAWRGELRSGARANLLMGVASNRVDVKQAAARAERALEQLAEPLCALFLPPDRWPARLFELAWLEMVRNAAHDSICACSVDEVCDAVLHRYAEARQIADGLTRRALRGFGDELRTRGPYVVNASAGARSGLVELTVPGEGPVEGAQLLEERPAVVRDERLVGPALEAFLDDLRSQQLGPRLYVTAIDLEEDDEGFTLHLRTASRLWDNIVVDEVKRELRSRLAARPTASVRVLVDQEPSRRILAHVDEVPGYGWTRWAAVPATVEPVRAEGITMTNGLVTVEVDERDGTFSVDGVAGFDRLVDGGDHGDTYNYTPPESDTVVDRPDDVEVVVVEDGPMRARLQVRRRYTLPERIAERRRVGSVPADVTTMLELRAGERLVRVTTSLDNRSRDHRLRTHFPLPLRATTSTAECAFAVVERGLTAEGGDTEVGLPTFPSRRFVQAGGLTVVHEGLLEYELVDIDGDGAATLALTLLRSTGMLSRVELRNRPLPAGPPLVMEGSQALGAHEVRYAVHIGACDPYAVVDAVFLPLRVVQAAGGGTLPDAGSALDVSGAQVSAVQRGTGGLEVRVFNPTPESTDVRFPGRSGWRVDLRGRPVEHVEDGFPLRPWGIATVRFA